MYAKPRFCCLVYLPFSLYSLLQSGTNNTLTVKFKYLKKNTRKDKIFFVKLLTYNLNIALYKSLEPPLICPFCFENGQMSAAIYSNMQSEMQFLSQKQSLFCSRELEM